MKLLRMVLVCVCMLVVSESWRRFLCHEIVQAGILEWVAISYSRGSFRPRDQTCISCVSCIGRQIFFFFH